jgi:hypothetical protein
VSQGRAGQDRVDDLVGELGRLAGADMRPRGQPSSAARSRDADPTSRVDSECAQEIGAARSMPAATVGE